MRRRYWSFFNRARYSVFYYERYQEHCKFILRVIKIVLALVSCGSIAAWSIWAQFPAAWAFILACAQVASILQTNLPYSKDIICLDFAIPQMNKLMIDITHTWDEIDQGKLTDSDISDAIQNYEHNIQDIVNQYLSSLDMAQSFCCKNKATKDQKAFFAFYDKETEEVNNDAQTKCTSSTPAK